jgi:hypothetical protein
MSAQKCLEVMELLELILRFLDDRQTLLDVAVSCRGFSAMAKRVLWINYGDLIPWLRLLPLDLWDRESLVSLGHSTFGFFLIKYQRFLRSPTAEDLRPVKCYSSRLRRITINHRVNEDILPQLNTLISLPLLFPSVRSIKLCRPQSDHLPLTFLPETITLHSRLCLLKKIIRNIPVVSPRIKYLRFESHLQERQVPERHDPALLASLFLQCVELRSVRFRSVYLDQTCLKNLGALAELRTLVWAWEGRHEVFQGNQPVGPFFPQLLHYSQSHMSDFQSFIKLARLITSPKLETVDLTCHNINCLRLAEVFTVLKDYFDRDALQQVKITRFPYWSIHSERLGNTPVNLDTLSPLLPFHNLRVLVITDTGILRKPLSFHFDNTALGKIASSFPLLETLILGFKGSDETWLKPYKITLEGILQLVGRCPRLRELHLRFNLCTDEPPIIDAGFTGRCPDLHTLNIFDSPISHGEEMGAILAQLFPKPPMLSFDPSVEDSQWKKVDEVFAALPRD